jgi:hypothetical protein
MRQQRQRETAARASDVWEQLRPRIEGGKILPVVGNSVLNDMLFPSLAHSDKASPEAAEAAAQEGDDAPARQEAGGGTEPIRAEDDSGPSPDEALLRQTVDEVLADILAEEQGYPFADTSSKLARVAQFISYARQPDPGLAKRDYLRFLKDWLILFSQGDRELAPLVTRVQDWPRQPGRTFSDLATALGYPRIPPGKRNPLDLLAQLHLPVYLTTSYYDFLERALHAVGRPPRTHACFWNRDPRPGDAYYPDPDFIPDADHPVVYHLYGFEKDPESIVLAEDDYLDFLVKVARESQSILPTYLTQQLAESSLILVGYRPQDWDFRILFRGVLTSCVNIAARPISVAIQLEPSLRREIADREKAEQDAETYLEKYFRRLNFAVEWSDVYTFTADLLGRWEQWRRGQR